MVRDAHKAVRTAEAGEAASRRLLEWDRVLGIGLEAALRERKGQAAPAASGDAGGTGAGSAAPEGKPPAEEIEGLIAEREAARKAKDFRRADEIRRILLERGVAIKDTPQGTRWSYV